LKSNKNPRLINQPNANLKQWGLGFHLSTHLLQIKEEGRRLGLLAVGEHRPMVIEWWRWHRRPGAVGPTGQNGATRGGEISDVSGRGRRR